MPSHAEVIERLIAERDEARQAARRLLRVAASFRAYWRKQFVAEYPWLEEE